MKHFIPFSLLITALLFSTASHASIYKTVDKNGKVSFSDAPDPNDKDGKQTVVRQSEHQNTIETGRSKAYYDQKLQDSINISEAKRQKQWDEYSTNVKNAQQALKSAETAMKKAQEPQAGDRVFTKTKTGGFSRESNDYKARISSAESALTSAQQQLRKAKKNKPKVAKPRPPETPSIYKGAE